jgi:hypothetical protein
MLTAICEIVLLNPRRGGGVDYHFDGNVLEYVCAENETERAHLGTARGIVKQNARRRA